MYVYENNGCFLLDPYTTHTYTVWAKMQNFLNVKSHGMYRYYWVLKGQERLRHEYIWNVGTAPHTFLNSALDNVACHVYVPTTFNAGERARGTHRLDGPQRKLQGGSNMTGTDLCANKPHCAAAVRPWESEATSSTLPPARVRTCSVLSGSC